MAYRQSYRRRTSFTAGRVAKPNARPGKCRGCGEQIPAYGGQLWREPDGSWSVVHVQESQGGWLMNPQPVRGGCPADTDRRNAELHAAGFFGPDAPMPASERDHITRAAATGAATAPERPARRSGGRYGYTSSGARVTERSSRCEDAPCCGCCD